MKIEKEEKKSERREMENREQSFAKNNVQKICLKHLYFEKKIYFIHSYILFKLPFFCFVIEIQLFSTDRQKIFFTNKSNLQMPSPTKTFLGDQNF